MESMLKAAGICAMYRGGSTILMDDALHAIKAAEEWLENLHRVVAMISAGDWQRLCDEIEDWVRQRGGSASKAQILNRFRNSIAKDGREIDNYLNFLVDSGVFNRLEASGGAIKFEVNGE
jgi:malate synthase